MSPRPIEIEDLLAVRFPHDPTVSPDGTRVVFALGRLDVESNEIRSALWMVPTGGGPPSPFTGEEARDTKPTWSPDGRRIAFLSTRGGRRLGRRKSAPQLWVMPAGGGEAVQRTFFRHGVAQPAWSPDGRTLAFASRGGLEQIEQREDEEVVVREIRRAKFKFDGFGWVERPAHIWIVSPEAGTPVRLTDGEFDHEFPVWLNDHEIVCVANRTPAADLSLVRGLWAVDVRTREMRQLTQHGGPCLSPAPSPDGRWIAFIGHDLHAGTATNMAVYVVPSAGGPVTNLTERFDRSVGNAVGSDLRLAPLVPRLAWDGDGAILFLATDAGQTHLYRVRPEERTVRQVSAGSEVIADFHVGGGTTVVQRIGPASFDELWVATDGHLRPLTGVNDGLTREVALGSPERFPYTGADGWPMEGWILTPPGFDPSRRYPAVLRIHGGPHAAFGEACSHYAQLLAARGYVVIMTNPRGSQGYGETFTRAVVGDWGGKDAEDILRGLEAVLARGFVDPGRVAVTGGSYGGFMTNWLITHTPRFRCAVSEVCVSNLHNFYGTSDIGATWGEAEWGATPWDDPQTLLARSPLTFVRNVQTPVLLTANEDDHRCPVEQSEQFFIALKKLGKEAVFLRFPGESHTMSSTGRPRARLERLKRLLEWYALYLQEARSAVPAGR
ncbi:MAG: S9 family peptidase [Armatimonadota bacterium]|nr:S9 family peptidase [Armatimonadota bacterium]